jgi:hypothetical protein
MSDTPLTPAPQRDANGRYRPGAPGRPRGAGNRFSRAVAMAVLEDFAKHRERTLKRLREDHVASYAAMVSRLLPRGADLMEDEGEETVVVVLPPGPAEAEPAHLDEVNGALGRLESLLTEQERALGIKLPADI